MAERKNRKKLIDTTTVVTSVVCLLPMLYSALVYADLPEQVAIHWGADGNPNGWAPKWMAAFLLPLLLFLLNLVCQLVSNAEPRAEARPAALMLICRWFIAVLGVVVLPVTLLIAQGKEIDIALVCVGVVGALLVMIGNYLPKCRQNYTLGIKLPWTLASEENWNRTHRLAGPVWMAGGLLFIVFGLCAWPVPAMIVVLACALIPTVYSFVLYRKGI